MAKRSEDGGRSKVVAAARQLFLQNGFHRTAMSELSERAEVSIGQIYRLFDDKDDMIAAIIQEDTDRIILKLAKIRDAVANGSLDARDGFRHAALNALGRGEQALTLEALAEGFRTPPVGEKIKALCERYRAMLGEIVVSAEPAIEPHLRNAVEDMLVVILFGLRGTPIFGPRLSDDETADFVAQMILSMISARP